jgi:hypothetical protein
MCATIIAVESSKCYKFWVCVCSFRYSAWNAHAPYCALWPVRLYSIFPHYVTNDTIIGGGGGGNIKHEMYALIFSTTFVWHIFHSKKNWARNHQKCVLKCPLLSDFNETWIFSTDFRNIIQIQMSWKSVHWEPSCSMRTKRRTDKLQDRHNFANASKIHNFIILRSFLQQILLRAVRRVKASNYKPVQALRAPGGRAF